MRSSPLAPDEIEAYRRRVTGIDQCPGGAPPPGMETAARALHDWHLRNLATIDALNAEIQQLKAALAEANGSLKARVQALEDAALPRGEA